jgi:hypothetical protein
MSARQIADPADMLTPELADEIARRYRGEVVPIACPPDDYAERFAAVCDAVIQVLWAEQYETDTTDPGWHTSDPARAVAGVMLAAAGITPDAAPAEVTR